MPSEEKPNGRKLKPKANGKARQKQGTNKEFVERQWKPGQSGNPGGRPPGRSIQVHLDSKISDNDGKIAKALGQVIIDQALDGDFRFCQLLLERIDGKVPDRVAGPDGESLFRVVGLDVERIERRMDGDMEEE